MIKASFSQLAAELESLGFERQDTPKDRVIFAYPESKHWFILRPHLDDEPVNQAALSAIRFQLDAWGYIERDEFDEHLRQRALVG